MLVRGVNDSGENLKGVADFISKIDADKSFISIPIRPPAENWVESPTEESLNEAYNIFMDRGVKAEYLIDYEANEFVSTGDIRGDILSISSVHPLREDSLMDLLRKTNSKWSIVEDLIRRKEIMRVVYRGKRFYVRRLPSSRESND
ncbi:MAG TPA: hypothetical protein ENG62_00405 [Thermoplasmatales archaeon]|nr:hypothetical protein [Thermoplasmatales archaeon]